MRELWNVVNITDGYNGDLGQYYLLDHRNIGVGAGILRDNRNGCRHMYYQTYVRGNLCRNYYGTFRGNIFLNA